MGVLKVAWGLSLQCWKMYHLLNYWRWKLLFWKFFYAEDFGWCNALSGMLVWRETMIHRFLMEWVSVQNVLVAILFWSLSVPQHGIPCAIIWRRSLCDNRERSWAVCSKNTAHLCVCCTKASILTSPGCWLQVTWGPLKWQEEWFPMFPNVGLAPTVDRNTRTNPRWNITFVSCTQTWLTRCAAICALVPSPCVMFTRRICGRSISRGVEPGTDAKLECSSSVSWNQS